MNRPGGNLTGVTVITNQLWPKRLELLREWISPIPLVAFLVNWNNVSHAPAMRELNDVARRIGQDVMVLNANAEGDIEPAFATLAEKRSGVLQRAAEVRVGKCRLRVLPKRLAAQMIHL